MEFILKNVHVFCRRSAHERLFGTKPNQQADGGDPNGNENNFNTKASSLERSQDSKSVRTYLYYFI